MIHAKHAVFTYVNGSLDGDYRRYPLILDSFRLQFQTDPKTTVVFWSAHLEGDPDADCQRAIDSLLFNVRAQGFTLEYTQDDLHQQIDDALQARALRAAERKLLVEAFVDDPQPTFHTLSRD